MAVWLQFTRCAMSVGMGFNIVKILVEFSLTFAESKSPDQCLSAAAKRTNLTLAFDVTFGSSKLYAALFVCEYNWISH